MIGFELRLYLVCLTGSDDLACAPNNQSSVTGYGFGTGYVCPVPMQRIPNGGQECARGYRLSGHWKTLNSQWRPDRVHGPLYHRLGKLAQVPVRFVRSDIYMWLILLLMFPVRLRQLGAPDRYTTYTEDLRAHPLLDVEAPLPQCLY